MILVINYANELYKNTQRLNTESAFYFGADLVKEYSPRNIKKDFYEKNKKILDLPRGNGYWLWKPYIILDAFSYINEGDYLFYCDSGAAFVDDIHYLTNTMEAEKSDIMVFELAGLIEKNWTKRDAFVLMDCDAEEYTDTNQSIGTYILLKKSESSIAFIEDYLKYAEDERIVTDLENQMGKDNYEGFRAHRHDQSILSLLSKKYKLKRFRDPSQYGLPLDNSAYDKELLKRSQYPQILDSHRAKKINISFAKYLSSLKNKKYNSDHKIINVIRRIMFRIKDFM